MLETHLRTLGLTTTEIQVYLAIVLLGRTTYTPLAKAAGINRTTTYSAVKQLLARGIISEDLGARPTTLVALPASDLEQLISKETQSLEAKRAVLTAATKELANLAKAAQYSVPKIVFIEEDRLEAYLYKQASAWNESILTTDPGKAWWGFQDHTFVEPAAYGKWIDWYWQKAAPKDLELYLLTNQSDIETEMVKRQYEHRHIKLWNKSAQFSATTWICGDYVVMINTKQQPYYLIEIHDRVMAHNFRELFKGIWENF